MKPPHHRQLLGRTGEDFAASYLQRHGFKILERNFKARYGEIDIIALDGEILVFVEVKTRLEEAFGRPEEAVTARKLAEVKQTALYYKLLHPELPESLRIDVIAIQFNPDETIKYLRHLPNVTL